MAAMNDTDLYPGWQGYAYPAGAGRKAQIDAQSPSKAAGMTVAEEDTCRARKRHVRLGRGCGRPRSVGGSGRACDDTRRCLLRV